MSLGLSQQRTPWHGGQGCPVLRASLMVMDTEALGLETISTHAQLSTQLPSSKCLLPGKYQCALPPRREDTIGIILNPCGLGTLLFGQQADLTESEGKTRADSALWLSLYVVCVDSRLLWCESDPQSSSVRKHN